MWVLSALEWVGLQWSVWRGRLDYRGRHHIRTMRGYMVDGEVTEFRVPVQPITGVVMAPTLNAIHARAHGEARQLGRRRHGN